MAEVTIIKNGKEIVVDIEGDDKTILEICDENDIEIEKACGGNGVCTTCLVNVTEGADKMSEYTEQEDFMLGNADDPSMRLGCQCKPSEDCTVELAY